MEHRRFKKALFTCAQCVQYAVHFKQHFFSIDTFLTFPVQSHMNCYLHQLCSFNNILKIFSKKVFCGGFYLQRMFISFFLEIWSRYGLTTEARVAVVNEDSPVVVRHVTSHQTHSPFDEGSQAILYGILMDMATLLPAEDTDQQFYQDQTARQLQGTQQLLHYHITCEDTASWYVIHSLYMLLNTVC